MAWYEGELLPVDKDWQNAPEFAMSRGEECEHENGVVALQEGINHDGGPVSNRGMIYLHCMYCDSQWQEPLSNIKGSPWEGT